MSIPLQPLPYILSIDDILPTINRHIKEHGDLVARILRDVDHSAARFDNVLEPLAHLENAQAGEQAVIEALKYCSPDKGCQQVAEQAQELWRAYSATVHVLLFELLRV